MKKILFCGVAAIMIAVSSLTIDSCKKDKTALADSTDDTELYASDDAKVESEANQALEDVNTAINVSGTFSGKTDALPCGASIDTSQKADGIIVLTFDGTTKCVNESRTRSGKIKIQLLGGMHWMEKGATIAVTFTDYKVTRLADNKSITFNGSHSVTNVNGGLVLKMMVGDTIVRKIRADMSITFDDNSTRKWQAARTHTYTLNNTELSISTKGDTTIGGVANIAVIGENRKGLPFAVVISKAVVVNSSCGWHHPVSGIRIHNKGGGSGHEITVTYGVDANGNEVSTGCPEYYKLNWTNKKKEQKELIKKY